MSLRHASLSFPFFPFPSFLSFALSSFPPYPGVFPSSSPAQLQSAALPSLVSLSSIACFCYEIDWAPLSLRELSEESYKLQLLGYPQSPVFVTQHPIPGQPASTTLLCVFFRLFLPQSSLPSLLSAVPLETFFCTAAAILTLPSLSQKPNFFQQIPTSPAAYSLNPSLSCRLPHNFIPRSPGRTSCLPISRAAISLPLRSRQ